nr:hypothetical protein [Nakamurella deserti]
MIISSPCPDGSEEIDAAAAVLGVDLARALQLWIRPVRDPAVPEPGEGPVEQVVVDQEGVVLELDLDRRLGELQQDTVGEPEVDERSPGRRPGDLHQLLVEPGGPVAVGGDDDRVVEAGRHGCCSSAWRRRGDPRTRSGGWTSRRSGAECAAEMR